MTKIISILNHKGGVGKTTTSANLAAGLNLLDRKVLMIDMDPQANLTAHFGLSQETDRSIYQALKNMTKLPVTAIEDMKNFDIVTSSTDDMADIELQLAAVVGREYILKELLTPIKNLYDVIIIDCPPSLGILTLNALSTSDMAIIAVEPAKFSIDGMKKIYDAMAKVKDRINPHLNSNKILITRYNSNKIIHQSILENIRDRFKDNVFKNIIRSNVSLEEAAMQGTDIFRYNRKSNGATDYMGLCEELYEEMISEI